jgi:ATP-dependent Clp protease protease subunit
MYIYGEITEDQWYEEDITPTMVSDALNNAADVEFIDVYINSPGGDISAGNTIYNQLKRHPALIRTYVDGIAASAASTVLQAGDERIIAANGIVMIHNAMSGVWGYADDMRKRADVLDKLDENIKDVYLERVNVDRDKLTEMMNAETYMTASEAIEYAFVDSLSGESVAISNKNNEIVINSLKIDPKKYKNLYKNSTKITPFEPTPEPVDYSEIEKTIAINNVTLLESEMLAHELAADY